MISAASYYTYKLYSRTRLRKLILQNNVESLPGMVKFIQNFPFSRRIILFFGNAKLVHYGDQLFFLPIALLLRQLNIEINIVQPGNLYNLWTSYNFPIFNNISEDLEGALWISKDDMLPFIIPYVIKQKGHFLGFNFGKMKESQPISKLVALEFINIIKKLDKNFRFNNEELEIFFKNDFQPVSNLNRNVNRNPVWLSELDKNSTKKFLIFSDFLNSGFLKAIWRRKHLYNLAEELKNKYALVYIGSQKEKSSRRPSFITLDLRGETNPSDLFSLFNHPSIIGYVGFDTYPLHVATLNGKFLYIIKKSVGVDDKKFIPFLPNRENLIKFIK